MPEIKAIQTRYKGCHFRSRLEARWAVYLDAIDCPWQYEPEGFHLPDGTLYLPDFWLPVADIWVEVKPTWPTEEEVQKAFLLAKGTGKEVLFFDGPPRDTNYWAVGVYTNLMEPEDIKPNTPAWNDYLPFLHKGKHFYACWGACDNAMGSDRPNQTNMWTREIPAAVEAALSARFEFGESGRT